MIRILLVDDHAVVRAGLIQILAAEFTVRKLREAQNAEEAIAALEDTNWDLVISDISMPGKSGVDLLRHVKRTHPAVPVLLLSTHSAQRYAVQVMQLGASGYLQKDVVAGELCAAVDAILRGQQYWGVDFQKTITASTGTNPLQPLHSILTPREFEIFFKLGHGESVTDIADELCLSVQTVSTYRARILEKMHMSNNADIMHYAIRNDLDDPDEMENAEKK